MSRILVVFGTRPEAIKMAPVVDALRLRRHLDVRVCVTAQHREMLDQVLTLFGIVPDFDLDLMRQRQDLAELTSAVILGMRDVLRQCRPSLVLVHGDTTTSFAATLAAFYEGIPVGHVEAGLRTKNVYAPWPEELNRRLTAVMTTLHFAPTDGARRNLLAEGVPGDAVWVTGNTVVDALHHIRGTDAFRRIQPTVDRAGRLLLVTLHRRESWGAALEQMCRAIRCVVERHGDVRVAFPVHLNPAVRECVVRVLDGIDRVSLMPPLDYLSFLAVMDASWLVLTDSGGVQEEAPVLGKPVLVLRETTERPEAVESGVARLVGTREQAITDAVEELLRDPAARDRMARAVSPFGDGQASRRIADVLTEHYA